jgi:hypothetical protein
MIRHWFAQSTTRFGSLWEGMPAPRRRVVAWITWPALVGIACISVIHFLRYRMGIDIQWSWDVFPVAIAAATALFLLLVLDARLRSDGGHNP